MAQPAHKINDLPELFWAWFAGFIDGDGCIGLYGDRGIRRPRVTVTQKERHILDVIVKRLGVGKVHPRSVQVDEIYYGIAWGSAASRTICERILPYLVTEQKRERARLCLAWSPVSKDDRKNSAVKNPRYKEAVAMYLDGIGMSTIAKTLGVSDVCILKWLRYAGVPRRSLSEAQRLAHARRGKGKRAPEPCSPPYSSSSERA